MPELLECQTRTREARKGELTTMFDADLQSFGIVLGLYGDAVGNYATVAGKTRDQIVEAILDYEATQGKFASDGSF